MPNPQATMPAGMIVSGQEGTAGLQVDLAARVKKDAISTSGADLLDNPTASRVASAKAVSELIAQIPALTSIIDDALTSNEKTWSSQKIQNFVVENDDSEYFVDIADRDAFTVTPERNGVIAIVVDASADPVVGTEEDGTPLGALYIRKDGVWKFLFTKGYKKVNFAGYVHEDGLAVDLSVNDPKIAASSALTHALAVLVASAADDANNMEIIPEITSPVWDETISKNRVECLYKPKGHPINFECGVLDEVTGTWLSYGCEFVESNGVTFMEVMMVNHVDLSSTKVRFSYLHNGKENA